MKQIAAKLSRIGSAGFGDYQIRLGLKRRDFSMTVVKRRFRKVAVDSFQKLNAESPSLKASRFEKSLRVDASLLQNRTQRSLGHVTRMIRDGGIPIRTRMEPDLVASSSLTVEREAKCPKLPCDLPIPKARETAHQAATTIV